MKTRFKVLGCLGALALSIGIGVGAILSTKDNIKEAEATTWPTFNYDIWTKTYAFSGPRALVDICDYLSDDFEPNEEYIKQMYFVLNNGNTWWYFPYTRKDNITYYFERNSTTRIMIDYDTHDNVWELSYVANAMTTVGNMSCYVFYQSTEVGDWFAKEIYDIGSSYYHRPFFFSSYQLNYYRWENFSKSLYNDDDEFLNANENMQGNIYCFRDSQYQNATYTFMDADIDSYMTYGSSNTFYDYILLGPSTYYYWVGSFDGDYNETSYIGYDINYYVVGPNGTSTYDDIMTMVEAYNNDISIYGSQDIEAVFTFNDNPNINIAFGSGNTSVFISDASYDSNNVGAHEDVVLFEGFFKSNNEEYNQIFCTKWNAYGLIFDGTRCTSDGYGFVWYVYYRNTRTNTIKQVMVRPTNADTGISNGWLWPNGNQYKTITLMTNRYNVSNLIRFNNYSGTATGLSALGGSVGLGDAFTLIAQGFQATTSLLSIQVLPNITLGLLLFLPLIAGIVIFIVWIVKR